MRVLTAWAAAVTMSACAGSNATGPAGLVEIRGRLDRAGGNPVDVIVRVQPEHRRHADRYLRAAISVLAASGAWLDPYPRSSLTIVDPPWRSAPAAADDAVVIERTPWWTAPTAMAPEIAAARGVSRRVWREAFDTAALPVWFVDGLAEYTARRAVAPLFEHDNNPPGYAFLEGRYFGRFVPKFVRIRLLAESDGDPMPAYRARPFVAMRAQPESAADARSLTAKTVLALNTLERWLGQSIFDDVLATFARSSRGARPAMADLERIAGEVSGQNLSWFFDHMFRSSSLFDYGVDRLTSERQADGSYATTIVARRYGDAVFAGTAAPRVGPFERGRGLTLLVTFAGGERRIDYWDGRDRETTFAYRGSSPAIAAAIDPDRTLLVDLNRTNNSRTLGPGAAATATRWAGRWIVWMEDLLLSYAALV